MNESQYRSNFINYLYPCKKDYYSILKSLQTFCECNYANDITFTRQQAKLLMKYISKLHKIIDELEVTRIDKAIEYIERNWIEYSDFQYVDNDDELNIDCESIKELLDILKGSDSND